jgi:hypothetical protein
MSAFLMRNGRPQAGLRCFHRAKCDLIPVFANALLRFRLGHGNGDRLMKKAGQTVETV